MQTTIKPLPAEFEFAGFTFPKYVWMLPSGSKAKRLEHFRNPVTGPYQHAPKPIRAGSNGAFFYLGSDFMPGLRWEWCDEVKGVRIDHTGWYCDEFQYEKIRGLVFRLPKSRGFLAGWSMGKSMASEVEACVYETESKAAYAADSLAESAAERQREHEERERAEVERDEALRLETEMLAGQ